MFHLNKFLIKNVISNKSILKLCSLQNSNLAEWNEIKSSYSQNQLKQILNTLNRISGAEIQKLGLSDEKVKILESNKNEKNKYESLDDLITLNVMQVNELGHLCSNLSMKIAKKPRNVVSPAIGKKKLESIKTAIGLRIKDKYISWTQVKLMGSECVLSNWESHEISELSNNANISQIIQKVKDISQTIPNADAFVMEKDSSKPAAKISVSMLRSSVRHQQLLSTMLTLLSTKNNLDKTSKTDTDFFSSLYMMRPYAYAQLFKLFVGNEVVSAVDTVDKLLLHGHNDSLKLVNSVSLNDDVTNKYQAMDQYMKEELSRSLLLTLSFFELAILSNYNYSNDEKDVVCYRYNKC